MPESVPPSSRRIAIVHEWFDSYAGSERVVEQLIALYPQADVFACVDFLPPDNRDFLQGHEVRTTFIQRLPGARKHFRTYLPLMPVAVEQLDLSAYDLVLSSSHAVAKGVITGPHQLHISYVHSPMRYAWDLQHQYLDEAGLQRGLKSAIARLSLHYLRMWDLRTANGVDAFVANSEFIRRRIQKVYRRDATVIYPPVDIDRFPLRETSAAPGNFFLTASRMVPYKRMPLIVEAFGRMPDLRLVVVGDGPELPRVKAKAGPNVELVGHLPQREMVKLMQQAQAFVFAAEEDFGITPVEAQACGTPVIAYGRGGSLETVRGRPGDPDDVTGLFFDEQSVESIVAGVRRFQSMASTISPLACRGHADAFSVQEFRRRMSAFVEEAWVQHRS